MTVNQLYGIVVEVAFGSKQIIYVVTDTFRDRQILGPMLNDLLEENGVERMKGTPSEWGLKFEQQTKYIRFVTGYKGLERAERNYSTVIDL